LAARWLATELALPLIAVDLAALTSKWIGETEKNLAQVFARAERTCAVLLFDEADSVFGARTDVGSANDRFANNQTNYLLQRIETYDGIIILTTNARQRLDTAFARRLDTVIEFPLPGPVERRALWQLHLGSCAETGTELDAQEIDCFAGLVDLPGGHVRNAVLAARAMALAEERALQPGDITLALRAEYNKLGRAVPADLHSWREAQVGVDS
jgi:SpoVK/Ycf46/Vps4 family AAA+-type ATPase